MKVVLLLLAVFTAQTFANDFLECFSPVLNDVTMSREELAGWFVDLYDTTARLQDQRQRCTDIPRNDPPTAIQDRIIQACNAAWSASFAYETARLLNALRVLDPELAALLQEQAAYCFTSEPEPEVLRARYGRILQNIF